MELVETGVIKNRSRSEGFDYDWFLGLFQIVAQVGLKLVIITLQLKHVQELNSNENQPFQMYSTCVGAHLKSHIFHFKYILSPLMCSLGVQVGMQ